MIRALACMDGSLENMLVMEKANGFNQILELHSHFEDDQNVHDQSAHWFQPKVCISSGREDLKQLFLLNTNDSF